MLNLLLPQGQSLMRWQPEESAGRIAWVAAVVLAAASRFVNVAAVGAR
jgi:hypothetical protein